MSAADLTRWNRAGLTRLRYVDGNAAVYYDLLRRSMTQRFGSWPPAAPAQENAEQREQRLLAQFNAGPADWGLELAREVARATHVLTEYLDAYANESSLRTATQWDSVRQLVELLNYHPAPPASASTALIIDAKAARRGRLVRGFAVKDAPSDGSAPVVFETLSDLELDAALNALHLDGYDRSAQPLSMDAGEQLQLAERVSGLRLGEPVLLASERGDALLARLITGIAEVAGRTSITLDGPVPAALGFQRGAVLVHLKPADKLTPLAPVQAETAPQLIGDSLHLTSAPQGLRSSDVVQIGDGTHQYYRRVTSIDLTLLRFDALLDGPLRLDAAQVSRARIVSVSPVNSFIGTAAAGDVFRCKVAGDQSDLRPPAMVAAWIGTGSQAQLRSFEVLTAVYAPPNGNAADAGYTTFTLTDPGRLLDNPAVLYFPPLTPEWQVDTYLDDAGVALPSTITTTLPRFTSSLDYAVAVSGDQLGWARLENVATDSQAGQAELATSQWQLRASERFYRSRSSIYGHFKHQVRVHGWNENEAALIGPDLPLAQATRPEVLVVGRRLWIEQHGQLAGREATVTDLTATHVVIDPPLPASDGFTVGNTVLRGNVVAAGHGELQNERILGSGVASARNQAFVLDEPGVSFVADPTFPAGVRADIEVRVDGQPWDPVGALDDYDTGQPHYVVRMTEAGCIRVEFGDGVHGRRLTSGNNNVRIRFRLGTGLAGNVAAGRLAAPLRPHPLIDKVRQPLAASGGGDMESRDALKRNAPASLLTLGRAVSSDDYAHLATTQATVWQARAFASANAFKRKRVEVVVVPAGGIALDARLQTTLEDFLSSQSQPGVEVTVREFSRVWLHLKIVLRVVARDYDPQAVKTQVAARLQEVFALERRDIGAPLYMSDVFAVVEAVPGVRNSSCRLFSRRGVGNELEPAGQRIDAAAREVIFLDQAAQPGALQLQVEEFEL